MAELANPFIKGFGETELILTATINEQRGCEQKCAQVSSINARLITLFLKKTQSPMEMFLKQYDTRGVKLTCWLDSNSVILNNNNNLMLFSFRGEDWNFFWVNREWMLQSFDRHKFKDGQLVCHFRNDYEVNEHCCKTQYTVKFSLKEHVRLSSNPKIQKICTFVLKKGARLLQFLRYLLVTSHFKLRIFGRNNLTITW